MRATFQRLLAALALLALGMAAPAPAAPPAPPAPGLREMRANAPMRSHSGRFYIVGTNGVAKLQLLRWAEEFADKVEALVGIPLAFDHRVVRLVVREEPGAGGRVATSQYVAAGRLVQRLTVVNYDVVDRELAWEALVHLLLSGYGFRATAGAGAAPPPEVPHWLSLGVSQNLYPETKEQNRAVVLAAWRSRGLPPLSAVVEEPGIYPAGPGAAATNDVARRKAVCGLFAGWLLSLPDKPQRLQRLFDRVAEGGDVPFDWVAVSALGCPGAADAEERWDNWLVKQKRVVNLPGVAPPGMADLFRGELLLYPGDSGIPVGSNVQARLTARDLIPLREERWIPGVARRKTARLRLLATGRGPQAAAVADAYGGFFGALESGSGAGELARLLEAAERALRELDEAPGAAGEEAKSPDREDAKDNRRVD